jgi:hypothetical protein
MEENQTPMLNIDWKAEAVRFVFTVVAVCAAIYIMQRVG